MKKKKLTSIFLLMQSYGEFQQIPRKSTNSFSTCMDNGLDNGQNEEMLLISVHK